MRVLGVDLGERRIGLASSDSAGLIATPHRTLKRAASPDADHEAVAALATDLGAEVVVVGLPLSLDGEENEACVRARTEADAIARKVGATVRVEMFDERFTTAIAHQGMGPVGGRSGKRRRERVRRERVDEMAATVLLQSWIDAGRARPDGPAASQRSRD